MTLISCRHIKKSFGDLAVLKNINLDIQNGERIGLVGRNGAGKSTLAELLFGRLPPDEGILNYYRKELKTGYMMQSTSYSVNTFNSMMDVAQNNDAMAPFLELTGYLGLEKVRNWEMERFNSLSGGEKTKLALAHIWALGPNLLILDEPTNHLDFQGVEWLVGELEQYTGTALIISHDRYFLDRTVKRIVELEDGEIRDYAGNYSFYREEKARRHQSQLHQYQIEQKYKAKIEAEIARLEQWSSKAHREAGKVGKMAEMRAGVKEFYRTKAKKMDRQIKSRIKRLKKIEFEGTEKPKEELKAAFDFKTPEKRGRRILEAKSIGKSFGSKSLFRDNSFTILRGEKIGLLGPNGCGKTTLIRMILGEESVDQGELWLSPSAKAAYLTQDVGDLDSRKSVLDFIQSRNMTAARTLLANMGFDANMLMKPVGQLSLGERTRIKIANLIMQDNDLLILDEPTNHLDLHSREQLEETLSDYEGTIVLVSHDRYMLERLCDKMLIFDNGTIQLKQSGFSEATGEVNGKQKEGIRESGTNGNDETEMKMIVEHRISFLLGELAKYTPADLEYGQLDREYNELVKQTRSWQRKGGGA
ncbi:ribosomal protection-like ABC-F family protein [Paenibacillus tarimensis]